MKTPSKLYRYRPLSDELLEREIGALAESYLYAPPFHLMNDPMEAFYEIGSPLDSIIDSALQPTGKKISDIYSMMSQMIDGFALVSFSSTYEDLPMWAYYASNFAGMCLEFDTNELCIGDFQNEQLRKVEYARNALPALSVRDLALGKLEESVMARITRKRVEWQHEKEWRFVTGEKGPKYYLDDALRRVYLGPRVDPKHAARICSVLDKRPVEVLQGKISGFNLTFHTIKAARKLEECERIGAGHFDLAEHLYAEKELRQLLTAPFERLIDQCRKTAARPNMEGFEGIDIANDGQSIYFWTVYKLRNNHTVYHKQYFDRNLRPK